MEYAWKILPLTHRSSHVVPWQAMPRRRHLRCRLNPAMPIGHNIELLGSYELFPLPPFLRCRAYVLMAFLHNFLGDEVRDSVPSIIKVSGFLPLASAGRCLSPCLELLCWRRGRWKRRMRLRLQRVGSDRIGSDRNSSFGCVVAILDCLDSGSLRRSEHYMYPTAKHWCTARNHPLEPTILERGHTSCFCLPRQHQQEENRWISSGRGTHRQHIRTADG